MEKFNDPDFIRRLKEGHRSAHQELIDGLFANRFIGFVIRKYGLPQEDAKDIVMITASKIIQSIHSFDIVELCSFTAWAYKVLKNCAIDWIRKNNKWKFFSGGDLSIGCEVDIIEKLDANSAMRKALINLSPRYRQFIGLYLIGRSEQEISKTLNINGQDAYYVIKSRALGRLREEYEKLRRPLEVHDEKAGEEKFRGL
jgi:RNA polymerase sigma factor (sigma-70 family)